VRWWEHLIFWVGLGLFMLFIMLLNGCYRAAYVGEAPQIGHCIAPVEEHEGAYRYQCSSENLENEACCDYLYSNQFENPPQTCFYHLCTVDCVNWELKGRQCL
jgi:hypothetical protein